MSTSNLLRYQLSGEKIVSNGTNENLHLIELIELRKDQDCIAGSSERGDAFSGLHRLKCHGISHLFHLFLDMSRSPWFNLFFSSKYA